MWGIAVAIFQAIFSGLLARWKARHEIQDAVTPYKAEAEALAAPPADKHDDVELLRNDT